MWLRYLHLVSNISASWGSPSTKDVKVLLARRWHIKIVCFSLSYRYKNFLLCVRFYRNQIDSTKRTKTTTFRKRIRLTVARKIIMIINFACRTRVKKIEATPFEHSTGSHTLSTRIRSCLFPVVKAYRCEIGDWPRVFYNMCRFVCYV